MKREVLKVKKLPQDGFAPLMVSIIIIIVLSLLTVGFVTLIDNNKVNQINQMLNDGAYYAAQSGINDAIEAINNGDTTSQSSCQDQQPLGSTNMVDQSLNDYYSCLLINFTPTSLVYGNVVAGETTEVLLENINPQAKDDQKVKLMPIKLINIGWQPSPSAVSSNSFAFAPTAPTNWLNSCDGSGPCFPPASKWSSSGVPITGVLRVAITPITTTQKNNIDITDTSQTFTAFLYPSPGSDVNTTQVKWNSKNGNVGAASGMVISGNCNNNHQPDACSVSLDVSGSPNNKAFIVSLQSYYTPSTVTITDYGNNGNEKKPMNFINGQIEIDSTGYDQGVLKRIVTRIAANSSYGIPAFDNASGGSLCKGISAFPPNSNPQGITKLGSASSSCGF